MATINTVNFVTDNLFVATLQGKGHYHMEIRDPEPVVLVDKSISFELDAKTEEDADAEVRDRVLAMSFSGELERYEGMKELHTIIVHSKVGHSMPKVIKVK